MTVASTEKKKRGRPKQMSLPFMDEWNGMSEDGQDAIAAILGLQSREAWHGQPAVPPGSILEDVLRHFERNTNIPLEIPFIAVMSFLSGWLCFQNVKVKIGQKQTVAPKLWSVVLAQSSSGKTFALNKVHSSMKTVPRLHSPNSSVKFIEMIEKTPKGVWIRDEIGQLLQSIQTQSHMEGIKDTLLAAYSGDAIEYNTKKQSIYIDDHAFSILGLNVSDTFLEKVGAESLVDGFAQRFNYFFADKDKNRPAEQFPIYFDETVMKREDKRREDRIDRECEKILSRDDLTDATLTLTPDAIDVFKDVFVDNFGEDLPESFFRRVMMSMFSYSAVYHLLLDKRGHEIGNEAMAYAARVVIMHMKDVKRLLIQAGWSELEDLFQKCEAWKDRFEKRNKRAATTRDMVSGVRQIKSVAQAESILRVLRNRHVKA